MVSENHSVRCDIIDLSHPLSGKTPVYPGDDSPRIDILETAREPTGDSDRRLNNSRLAVGLHNGTHIDAPFHFFNGGPTIDQVPLGRCCGPAVRLDVRRTEKPGVIDAKDLQQRAGIPAPVTKVLLYSGWDAQWGSDRYFSRHPVLTRAAAELLVRLGCELVGVDFPSVDRPPFEAHLVLLGNDVLIVENLRNLGELGDRCEFFAVPLAIAGRDASPVRAFARCAALAEE